MRSGRKSTHQVARAARMRLWVAAPFMMLFAYTAFSMARKGDYLTGAIMLGLVCALLCAIPVWRSIRALRLASLYPDYHAALATKRVAYLHELAAELRRDERLVRKHLRGLSRLRLLPPLSISQQGDIRLVNPDAVESAPVEAQPPVREHRVVCQACGATGSAQEGQRNRCAYCGGTLSLPQA